VQGSHDEEKEGPQLQDVVRLRLGLRLGQIHVAGKEGRFRMQTPELHPNMLLLPSRCVMPQVSSTLMPEQGEHPPIPTSFPDFLFPNSKNTKFKGLQGRILPPKKIKNV
jgi:hypothetical protein